MKFIFFIIFVVSFSKAGAQELFVFTEPASNMAAKSVGVRFVSRIFKMTHDNKFSSYRLEPEFMIGVSKNLMVHLNVYASDMFQSNLKMEGASLYVKYRVFSKDDIHSHFRMAVYGKIALIDNPTTLTTIEKHVIPDGNGGTITHDLIHTTVNNEIDLEGTNSGLSTGVIATQLINKLAVSGAAGYSYRLNNLRDKREVIVPWHALNYSFSAGYLLFPKEYTSYKQTNINLYAEFLGTSSLDDGKNYLDIAPAVQFIINSIARIDIGYRTQLTGNTMRMANTGFLVRVEYNFLNVFSKK